MNNSKLFEVYYICLFFFKFIILNWFCMLIIVSIFKFYEMWVLLRDIKKFKFNFLNDCGIICRIWKKMKYIKYCYGYFW